MFKLKKFIFGVLQYMDFDDGEAMDIEEARLIISLKNDEINNLKSSVKAN